MCQPGARASSCLYLESARKVARSLLESSCRHRLSRRRTWIVCRLVLRFRALQQFTRSLPPGNILLALPVKPGLVAIQCGHNVLLSFGLVKGLRRDHTFPGGRLAKTGAMDFLSILGEAAKSARVAMSSTGTRMPEN